VKEKLEKAKKELHVYRLALKDPRTPAAPKLLLTLAFAYFMMPIDVIPDFIPVLGQLDDLIIVPGLVMLAAKMIPSEVIEDCRTKVNMR
jgi:uncharacterized membrane protein YkvA (DUF1232 family)